MISMPSTHWEILDLAGREPLEAKLERLPDAPAIYCFCQSITVDASTSSHELRDHLANILRRPHGPQFSSAVGPYEQVRLVHEPPYTEKFVENVLNNKLIENNDFRVELHRILILLQDIIPPYYVGETGNLQRRIREHLAGRKSDLGERIRREGLSWEDLVVKYTTVDTATVASLESPRNDNAVEDKGFGEYKTVPEEDDGEDDETAEILGALTPFSQSSRSERPERRFLEELITRLCRPRYIEKVGGRVIKVDHEEGDS